MITIFTTKHVPLSSTHIFDRNTIYHGLLYKKTSPVTNYYKKFIHLYLIKKFISNLPGSYRLKTSYIE